MLDDLIAKMQRHVRALNAACKEAEQITGRKLCLFAESGGLYLIDSERDHELSEGNSLLRARPYDEGGSILGDLGGTKFDGGGW